MIIFDLMLVGLVITTITLLSGVKIMYNPNVYSYNVYKPFKFSRRI